VVSWFIGWSWNVPESRIRRRCILADAGIQCPGWIRVLEFWIVLVIERVPERPSVSGLFKNAGRHTTSAAIRVDHDRLVFRNDRSARARLAM
jgi:hypothetical protein